MNDPAKIKTPTMANPLIAAVCDIRGFTDFTATVDSVNQSDHVDLPIKKRLLRDYDEIVKRTQRLAVQMIFDPVVKELGNPSSNLAEEWNHQYGTSKPLPCALKSTGDGFLVAVELAHEYNAVSLDLQCALAEPLTRGVANLVRRAKRHASFRDMLERFFKVWEPYLAMKFESTTFRVAGAIAIGTGQILDTEDVPASWTAADFLSKIPRASSVLKLKSDAYGHGVNLAFRLCDRAGRDKGPYVLLDRRIGQLLIKGVRKTKKTPWVRLEWEKKPVQPFRILQSFDGYSLTRFPFDKPLKGIDEQWCYALEEKGTEDPRKETPRDEVGTSQRHRKIR